MLGCHEPVGCRRAGLPVLRNLLRSSRLPLAIASETLRSHTNTNKGCVNQASVRETFLNNAGALRHNQLACTADFGTMAGESSRSCEPHRAGPPSGGGCRSRESRPINGVDFWPRGKTPNIAPQRAWREYPASRPVRPEQCGDSRGGVAGLTSHLKQPVGRRRLPLQCNSHLCSFAG